MSNTESAFDLFAHDTALVGSPATASTDEQADDETIRAAIYARTSSVTQQEGYSLGEQIHRCQQRCEQMDWTVTYVFQDEAESGADTDRPMFTQLMEQVEAGRIDVVVCWKLDRISRSLLHAVQIEQQLRDEGVALHSLTEQIDTTTPAGRFNFRNIANAAEFERDMIAQRTQMGFRALARERKWPNNQPPLGYNKTTEDRLVVDGEEAAVVRFIFKLYIDRRSMPQVAHELNQEGYTTKRGNDWNARAVRDVLQNEVYTGRYSVADVATHVPEYQILSRDTFETVTDIRYRFQPECDEPSDRPEMPVDRKDAVVNEVIDTYHEYVEQS